MDNESSTQRELESLGLVACRYQAGGTHPEELPMIAAEALAAGLDTPTLRELAGLPRRADTGEIHDAFVDALGEAGIGLPDPTVAERHALRRAAVRLVAGEITPSGLASVDWTETEAGTTAEQSFLTLIPSCACCVEYALGLDRQTWETRLRSAALALTSSPPIRPGC
ncbi:hypothetical protein [Streptomyces sp. NPDC056600]|uniref:hypothetical protein n=1 Tax=Streptomyces sp. NPDC056600 TaxID=3345874 RepID=UPI0036ADE3D1